MTVSGYLPAYRYYGWRIVAMASIVAAASAPGQTSGVSIFVDHIVRDLRISRTGVSASYLIGTLGGAVTVLFIGRILDRFGPRALLIALGGLFGTALIALSRVNGIIGLTLGFVGIRMLGQGGLSLTATTSVSLWFERYRGLAIGITTALGAAGVSFLPAVFEHLISAFDWRTAWLVEGVGVWAIVIPIAAIGMRDRPADVGQQIDGRIADTSRRKRTSDKKRLHGWTQSDAIHTSMFWAISLGPCVSGLLVTAISFNLISLLEQQGFSPGGAAAIFIPMAAGNLLGSFGLGTLADRVAPNVLMAAGMGLLIVALLWARSVSPGIGAIGFGIALGAASGSPRAVENAAMSRYFGLEHLGSIRSIVSSMNIAGSALGPVVLAIGYSSIGSYRPVLLAAISLPLLAAVFALLANPPGTLAACRRP